MFIIYIDSYLRYFTISLVRWKRLNWRHDWLILIALLYEFVFILLLLLRIVAILHLSFGIQIKGKNWSIIHTFLFCLLLLNLGILVVTIIHIIIVICGVIVDWLYAAVITCKVVVWSHLNITLYGLVRTLNWEILCILRYERVLSVLSYWG